METDIKHIIIFALSVIIALLLFSFGYQYGKSNPETVYIERIILEYDTAIIEIQKPPIIINKVKTKIEYIQDTIIESRPFIASLDTIIIKDTINAKFEFPDNLFSLELKKAPDSIMIQTIKIIETETKYERESWWVKPSIAVGGLLIGYGIGKVK